MLFRLLNNVYGFGELIASWACLHLSQFSPVSKKQKQKQKAKSKKQKAKSKKQNAKSKKQNAKSINLKKHLKV